LGSHETGRVCVLSPPDPPPWALNSYATGGCGVSDLDYEAKLGKVQLALGRITRTEAPGCRHRQPKRRSALHEVLSAPRVICEAGSAAEANVSSSRAPPRARGSSRVPLTIASLSLVARNYSRCHCEAESAAEANVSSSRAPPRARGSSRVPLTIASLALLARNPSPCHCEAADGERRLASAEELDIDGHARFETIRNGHQVQRRLVDDIPAQCVGQR